MAAIVDYSQERLWDLVNTYLSKNGDFIPKSYFFCSYLPKSERLYYGISHNMSNPLFIDTSARRLCRPKITKMGPSEHCTYICSWLLLANGSSDKLRPSLHILLGLVSWQHSLIGLAGLRQGLAHRRRNHSHWSSPPPALLWDPRSHTHKIKGCQYVRAGHYAQTGQSAETRELCSRSLATQITHWVAPLPPLSHRPCGWCTSSTGESAGNSFCGSAFNVEKRSCCDL